ncbi:MAG: glycosyltransferase family 4 protein [Pseudolabrys sp.]
MAPLNILHVLRAPVGGLFRHVVDLSAAQAERGHRVGMIADSGTGGDRAEEALRALAPNLALGLTRIPIPRQPGPGDLAVLRHAMKRVGETEADVVHGHGAKGGLVSRLVFHRPSAARVYTPHGGSVHYDNDALAGRIYLATEKLLMLRGDLFLFESAYSADTFRRKIGTPKGLVRVVHNGVSRAEFEPVALAPDATDLVFLGEMRALKGVDLLIDAVARLRHSGRAVTATLVGDGPDRAQFENHMRLLGLEGALRFTGALPARQAQALGRIMVLPSRAESLPYAVLETAAAGKPLITTRVGGIPEIFGPLAERLVPPDDAGALAGAIARTLEDPAGARDAAMALRERVSGSFSIDSMVEGVLAGYRAALDRLHEKGRR